METTLVGFDARNFTHTGRKYKAIQRLNKLVDGCVEQDAQDPQIVVYRQEINRIRNGGRHAGAE